MTIESLPSPRRLLAPLAAALVLVALAAVRPALAEVAEGQAVSFTSVDGVKLQGRWFAAPKGKPGAVLYLHMPTRSAEDWRWLAAETADKGLAGLALDFRGHGGSRQTTAGARLDRDTFGPADWKAALADVTAAMKWLREVKKVVPDRIHLVGADVGGSLALLHAAADPKVASVALLSPGLGYQELNVKGQVDAYGSRPLLMVVSEEDGYSVKSADVLEREAKGKVIVQRYVGAGHGTKMLNREGGLEQYLVAWLMGTLGDDGQVDIATPTVAAETKTSDGLPARDLAAEERKRQEDAKKQVKKDEKAISKEQAPEDETTRRNEEGGR